MLKNFLWWATEIIIWYIFFYIFIYSVKYTVSIGWVSLILILLASFGIFASPLTRHLSVWNQVLDKIIKKEEEKQEY